MKFNVPTIVKDHWGKGIVVGGIAAAALYGTNSCQTRDKVNAIFKDEAAVVDPNAAKSPEQTAAEAKLAEQEAKIGELTQANEVLKANPAVDENQAEINQKVAITLDKIVNRLYGEGESQQDVSKFISVQREFCQQEAREGGDRGEITGTNDGFAYTVDGDGKVTVVKICGVDSKDNETSPGTVLGRDMECKKDVCEVEFGGQEYALRLKASPGVSLHSMTDLKWLTWTEGTQPQGVKTKGWNYGVAIEKEEKPANRGGGSAPRAPRVASADSGRIDRIETRLGNVETRVDHAEAANTRQDAQIEEQKVKFDRLRRAIGRSEAALKNQEAGRRGK